MSIITVYIVSHNYGRFLEQAIQSVMSQTFTDWELIIFDDNSSDDTYRIASKYKDLDNFSISIFKTSENLGLQRIANLAIAQAKGDYLLRLDADDFLHPFALEAMYEAILSDLEYEMAYSDFYYTDEMGNILGTEKSNSRNVNGMVTDIVAPHGACSLISLSFLRSVNGYNENVDAQDGWDVWYKLKSHGRFIKVNRPLFYYRQHSSSLSRNHSRLIRARNSIIDDNLVIEPEVSQRAYCIIPIKENFPVSNTDSDPNFGINLALVAIRQALMSEFISKVVITSENTSILEKLKANLQNFELEQSIFILREKTSSFEKLVPLGEILNSANNYLSENNLVSPQYWVYLGLLAKKRDPKNISRALKLLISFNYKTVISVVEERSPIFTLGKSTLKVLNPGRFKSLEFYDEKVMKYNGVLIAVDNEYISKGDLFEDSVGYLEMSQKDSEEWS